MSETEDTKRETPLLESSYDDTAADTDTETAAPEKPRGGRGIALLALLVALFALVIASYPAYEVYRMSSMPQQPVETESAAEAAAGLQAEIAELRRGLQNVREASTSAVGQATGGLEARVAAQEQAVGNLKQELTGGLSEIRRELGTSSSDWLLAEAEYLLRLGNQRVAMQDDARGALALFEAADEIVRDTEGIAAFDLRDALANDIANLRAVTELDTDGVFLKLGALARQVNNLRQRQLTYSPVETETTEVGEDAGFGDKFLALMSDAGARLSTLVDYRSEGEVITPILPPAEDYYLRQNLVMQLQLSQMGVLRGDQAIYDEGLTGALTWVERYFNPDDSVTKAMQQGLMELEKIEVDRELPEVTASLREIRKLLAGFHEKPAREEAP